MEETGREPAAVDNIIIDTPEYNPIWKQIGRPIEIWERTEQKL